MSALLKRLAIAAFVLTVIGVPPSRAQTTIITLKSGTTITFTRNPMQLPGVPPVRSPPSSGNATVPEVVDQGKLDRESAQREKEWASRCKPEIYTDKAGISRYRYAKSGCDVKILN